jgi:hypothetical protein
MRALFAFTVCALTACATMRTANLPPACRLDYDRCLDACAGRPSIPSAVPPGTVEAQRTQQQQAQNLQIGEMGCAARCDKNAEACGAPSTNPVYR